ncbi:Uncharacterised protein [Mycobacteroides abscessus]|nr:Uncharacterised protein [Mycobacteroides abscessus]
MCVAEWARLIALRRSRSIVAVPGSPSAAVPSTRRPRCTDRPLIGRCTSSTSMVAPPSSTIVPWSASWPPASA